MELTWIDALVLAIYFLGTIGLGLYFTKRNRSTDDYFLGGRSIPGWAVGISLIGAMISSVTFLAFPADAFKTAWVRYLPTLTFPIVMLLAAYFFVPFFRRGTVTSAYQYLSLRFGPGISIYAACVFLLMQMVRCATIIYLLAMLLSPLLGIRVELCIILAGGATALYAVKGGFSAVLWTEVVQTIVLILGGLVSIAVIVYLIPGGLSQIISEAWEAGKLSCMDLNPGTGKLEALAEGFSLTQKTIPMLILLGVVQHFTGKFDQTTIQRWCSAKTAKEARKSMYFLAAGSLPVWGTFMFLGTCLWVYFQHNPSDVATAILNGADGHKAEEIMPYFITHVLPPGVAGLVIAAAMAAAMSALGGCISAIGMVSVNDIYRPYFVKNRSDKHYMRMGKAFSLGVSILMMLGAWAFYLSDTKTFTDLGIIVGSLIGGGMASIFLIGMLTRIGDTRSLIIGIGCTLAFTVWAMLMHFKVIEMQFELYYTMLLGNAVMFVSTCVAGLILKPKPRDLTNLTVWDFNDDPLV